jgi:acyl dehydratase
MPVNYEDLLARRAQDWRSSYSDSQVLLYNLSVGMGRQGLERELPFVFEKPALNCVPTFAALLSGGGAKALSGVGLNVPRILHGEERLSVYRPLPPSAELLTTSWVSEVVDKGADKGLLITVTSEARFVSGEPLYRSDHLIFARGDGGVGAPAKSKFSPHVLPERPPDVVHETVTRPDEALLYRLNGDRNPLHADPASAQRSGFSAPILHGMCSYGMACRAVLAVACDYDPARIKSFDARFTSPVYPGETIHTDIWLDGDVVSFRSRVAARDVVLLNNGRCVVSASST